MVTDVTRDKKTVSQSMFIISDEVVYHTSTNATLTSYTPKSLNNVIREVLLAQFQLFKTEKKLLSTSNFRHHSMALYAFFLTS